jgi:hypothetical protein
MTELLNLDGYRIETAQEPYRPGQTRNLPEPQVRIVRKSDGTFMELSRDAAFGILWERAHGTPEEETREWVQDLVREFYAENWQRPRVVAG